MTNKQRRLIFITLMMGTFITSMSVTVTIIMLPSIISDLSLHTATAQWLTSGATLAAGIMIPIAAFLIKKMKSKSYFVLSVIVFCLGSLISYLSKNFELLLIGRLVQAIGCGMLMPFSQIVLMTIYQKERFGSVMGIYALGATISPIIAPTLTGLIIGSMGWQAIFGLLLIIGVVSLLMGLVFMKNVTQTYKQSFNVLHVILSSIGFGGLLIGLSNVSRQPFFSISVLGAILIGVVCLILFVLMQLKGKTHLLNLRVFRYANFRMSVYLSMMMYLVCMGSGTILPIISQTTLLFTAITYAVITLPGAVLMAIVSILSGKFYDKVGAKPLMIVGCLLLGVGSLLGVFINYETSLFHIAIISCLLSCGMGCVSTPATTMALGDLIDKDRVDASSILSTLRQIASSISSTFAVVVYSAISLGYNSEIIGAKGAYICFVVFCVALALLIAKFIILNKKKFESKNT